VSNESNRMIFEIKSKIPKMEEAMKRITEHNETDFLKAGFNTSYEKIDDSTYHLIFTFVNPMAKAGMNNPFSRRLMIGATKKQLKNIDKDVQINYIKENKGGKDGDS
jgi:hypothetical protein